MAIYKFALLKYVKSWSTWIPTLISMLIVFTLGVLMPFVFLDTSNSSAATHYQTYSIISVSTIASSLAIFSAAFSAYKATQIYKSEIEDGTFLVLLSKPISRARIIFEKWLALITVIIIYTSIVIIFYEIMVMAFDPAKKIDNLTTPPISSNIFLISLILFFIILILNILFSSIALLISSKNSSASTIAAVSAIGALIPISGILPTFTLKNDYSLISKNYGLNLENQNLTKEGFDKINKIYESVSLDILNLGHIDNVFSNINSVSKEINSSNKYINKIAISNNEKNLYNGVVYFDLFYQVNQMSTIATDYLWGNLDYYTYANSSSLSSLSRPDVKGKAVVVQNDIKINKIINMFDETMKKYDDLINNTNYKETYYKLFDLVLKLKEINTPQTNDNNYLSHLKMLLSKFIINNNQFSYELLVNFMQSPIISSLINSSLIEQNLKEEVQNKKNPIRGDLKQLEALFNFKLIMDLGFAPKLIFSNSAISNYYLNNDLQLLSTNFKNNQLEYSDNSREYIENFINANPNFKNLIDKYCSFNMGTNKILNKKSVVELMNVLQLKDVYGIEIDSIKYEAYINKWVILGVYSFIALLLVPISYLVIKKQNIR